MKETVIRCNKCGKILSGKKQPHEYKSYFIGTYVEGILASNETDPGLEEIHLCPVCEEKFLKSYRINVDDFSPVTIKRIP